MNIYSYIENLFRFLLIFLLSSFVGCKKVDQKRVLKVETIEITEISFITVSAVGEIIDTGEEKILKYGFCWSTSENPSVTDDFLLSDTIYGNYRFNGLIRGLKPKQTYYVRSFATDVNETVYGSQLHFETIPLVAPSLTTDSISEITSISAVVYGNISTTGGLPIIQHGHCWATSANPTVDLQTKTSLGQASSPGVFKSLLIILEPETKYYVRSYVTNSFGAFYGSELSFDTRKKIILPDVSTSLIIDLTDVSLSIAGNINHLGNDIIIEHGHCWSVTPDPTIDLLTRTELGGRNTTGEFTSHITNLIQNTTYFIKAYAINSAGVAYGNEIAVTTFENPRDKFTDERDGKVYTIVQIGDQWWMAQNLDFFTAEGSWYYNNDSPGFSDFGRLYNWETAERSCPDGWDLPSDDEWKTLEIELGMRASVANQLGFRGTDQGTKLKSGSRVGFDALLGGYRMDDGNYFSINGAGYFWSSSEYHKNFAYFRSLTEEESRINRLVIDKTRGFSVRCVLD